MRHQIKTVGDLMNVLWDYPTDYPIVIGGSYLEEYPINVEHRELNNLQIINLWGGGQAYGPIGEKPLTDKEYEKISKEFLEKINNPSYTYTSSYGDHSLVIKGLCGRCDATVYYTYDKRIIERMVAEGLISKHSVDIEKVRRYHDFIRNEGVHK